MIFLSFLTVNKDFFFWNAGILPAANAEAFEQCQAILKSALKFKMCRLCFRAFALVAAKMDGVPLLQIYFVRLFIMNKSKIQNPKSKIEIGCQGWNYDDWTTKAGGETVFYPRGTKSNEMLEVYAEIFDTIEVDSTFYAIPTSSSVENWYKKTPENFTFSLKLPQEITHTHQLSEKSFPVLDEFCERVLLLKEKLASVLIQMPPQFEANKENAKNLREFLARLPKEIRFAIEFRHRDWLIEWTFEELEKNKVALCFVEGSWIPREMTFEWMKKPTADFSYVRFMGERDLQNFDKIYRNQDTNLQIWKDEIEKMRVAEIFVYFSNFYEGHAPASVNKLKKLFGQKIFEASVLENQGSLF